MSTPNTVRYEPSGDEDVSQLKALHDRLLEQMPEDAQHERGECPVCAMEGADDHDDSTRGGSMPDSFTAEDVDAAVAAATGPLHERLAELEAQAKETEVGRAVTEAVAAKDTEISELQTRLDAEVAAHTAAETKFNETEKFWSDAIAASEEAAQIAARREERVAQAKNAGVFNDDYIVENADRFAAMSHDDFAARLDEWRLIAVKNGQAPTPIPKRTALVAARSEDQGGGGSALGLISEIRRSHLDPRAAGGM